MLDIQHLTAMVSKRIGGIVELELPTSPELENESEIQQSEPLETVSPTKNSFPGQKSMLMFLRGENKSWQKKRMKIKDSTGCIKISPANVDISVEHLEPHPLQPRRVLNGKEVYLLTEAIVIHGLAGPLLVTPCQDDPERYYILDGTRRWNAVKSLKWEKVACNVATLDADELALGLMLAMDGVRQDFNPIEKGVAFRRLREMLQIGQRELAELLRIQQSEISRCEILKESLCMEVIDDYHKSADSRLRFNHLRELARLGDHPEQQQKFYKEAMGNKWTTKKLREEINNYLVVTPRKYKSNHKIKFQTPIFEVNIKAKRLHAIRDSEVYRDAGAIVQEIFTWHGIRGEEIPKWYETMAEYSRKQWRKERAKIQAQAVETDEES
jgi:ParB family transcriptional regulator, chromosome partitioning protein